MAKFTYRKTEIDNERPYYATTRIKLFSPGMKSESIKRTQIFIRRGYPSFFSLPCLSLTNRKDRWRNEFQYRDSFHVLSYQFVFLFFSLFTSIIHLGDVVTFLCRIQECIFLSKAKSLIRSASSSLKRDFAVFSSFVSLFQSLLRVAVAIHTDKQKRRKQKFNAITKTLFGLLQAFEELEELLGKYNICIAIKEKLVKDSGVAEEKAYDEIVLKLLTKPRARGKPFLFEILSNRIQKKQNFA